MPAYAVSRTRLLLEAEPVPAGARFFWGFDPFTGDDWGKVLSYHRKGRRGLPKRDVIGIGPHALARVRQAVLARWLRYVRNGYRDAGLLPAGVVRVVPELQAVGRTDYHNFTFGIGGTGAPAVGVRATGFTQRRPGQGWTAYGGPVGPGGRGGLPPGPARPLPPPPPKPPPKPKPKTPLEKAHEAIAAATVRQINAGRPVETRDPVFNARLFEIPHLVPPGPIAGRIAAYEIGEAKRQGVIAVAADVEKKVAAATRRHQQANARVWEIVKRQTEILDPYLQSGAEVPPDVRAVIDRMGKEIDALSPAVTKASDEYLALKARLKKDVLDVFRTRTGAAFRYTDPPPGYQTSDGPLVPVDAKTAGRVGEAVAWLQQTVTRGDNPVAVRLGMRANARAHYRPSDASEDHIQVAEGEDVGTVVHEFGHALETRLQVRRGTITDLAQEFLQHRVGNETPVDMYAKFGKGDPGEMGRKDKFDQAFPERSAYYVGKVYGWGDTEIIAMGVEKLYNDPVGFAKNDPEYFKFIAGILDGSLR